MYFQFTGIFRLILVKVLLFNSIIFLFRRIHSTVDNFKFFTGLFVGFLLSRYSYRKVAFCGALLNSTGLILTSQANSLTHLILTYSIIGGKYCIFHF